MHGARDWLRALLQAWAEGLEGCELTRSPRGDPGPLPGARWRFDLGPEGDALPVRVEVDDDAIVVRVGEWERALGPDDDAAHEAADLVAAALFGRIVAEVHRVRDKWVRYRLRLRVKEDWVEIADLRPFIRFSFTRPTVVELRNAYPLPEGVRLLPGGALPYAPWVGILALAEERPQARELAIDGELDLHPFQPREVADVVRAYIDACLERGVYELRLVHGKGIGNLRRTVHALLEKHPGVAGFRLGGSGGGSWGATVVDLKRPRDSR